MKLESLRRQAESPGEDVPPPSRSYSIALLSVGIPAILAGFTWNVQGVIFLGGIAVSGGLSGLLFYRPKRKQPPSTPPAETRGATPGSH